MKNYELRGRLHLLVREERRLTNEILELLLLALERRSWLEFGFSSLFDWLTRGFGYSPAAAMRRIEAARLLLVVPEAKSKLQDGALSLSSLAKVQGAIRAQEKVEVVPIELRAAAVDAVSGLSVPEAERKLVELFPAAAERAKREVHRVAENGSVRHSMNLSAEATENLKRAKELLSHKFPRTSGAEIISFTLEFLLEKKSHPRRPAASAAKVKSKVEIRRQILKEGHCSYHDPQTGVRCTSRYQIQLDHRTPKALGGTDTPENLRPLCRQHNLFAATQALGAAKMAKYWRSG